MTQNWYSVLLLVHVHTYIMWRITYTVGTPIISRAVPPERHARASFFAVLEQPRNGKPMEEDPCAFRGLHKCNTVGKFVAAVEQQLRHWKLADMGWAAAAGAAAIAVTLVAAAGGRDQVRE